MLLSISQWGGWYPTARNYPTQNINSAKTEKPWCVIFCCRNLLYFILPEGHNMAHAKGQVHRKHSINANCHYYYCYSRPISHFAFRLLRWYLVGRSNISLIFFNNLCFLSYLILIIIVIYVYPSSSLISCQVPKGNGFIYFCFYLPCI